MLNSFLTFINQQKLDLPAQPTLLTVSGGVDSIVMAHLFHRAGLPAAVVHCNFGLRGEESDQDELFVRELGRQYGFPVFVKNFETKLYAAKESVSTQMAARDLRYTWFEEIRKGNSYSWIATAHHANDALETTLLNLTRGTGIAGLHGIAARNRFVIRPLLFAAKDEIRHYAEQNHLEWREDRSNESLDYKRNVIRKKVVPVLKELNPSLESTFLVTAERLRAANALMNNYLAEWSSAAITKTGEELTISIDALLTATEPAYRLWHVLNDYGFQFIQIPSIIKSLETSSGKVFYSESHTLLKDRQHLIVKPVDEKERNQPLIIPDLIGIYTLGKTCLRFEKITRLVSFFIEKSTETAYLDEASLIMPLTVRQWLPGDTFCPFGMEGKQKKVSDLLIDLKLTLYQKSEVQVLLNGNGEIAWVVGIRSDERFRITDQTKDIIKVSVSV